VFQCLVWLLDRSEVMGSGLFWFGSTIGGEKGLGLHGLCTGLNEIS
jgi:hypothetical protein